MSFQYIPLPGDGQPMGRSKPNRRASVRYQCGPATTGRVVTVEKQEFLRAWLLDLSRDGVGLLLARPLAVGLHVYIQIKATATSPAFELFGRVVHATLQTSGDWIIGCELLRKLSDDELEALL